MKTPPRIFFVLSTAVLLNACASPSETPAASSESASQSATSRECAEFFNGKNLNGWDIYIKGKGIVGNADDVFCVKDGVLAVSGKEFGGISTRESFENFEMEFEFKWSGPTYGKRAKRARDSGMLFASNGEFGSCFGAWINGLEVNIIEGAVGDIIHAAPTSEFFSMESEVNPESGEYSKDRKKFYTSGKGAVRRIGRDAKWKDILGAKDLNDLEKPVGEWNNMRCIFNGGKLDVYLNGALVSHLDNYYPRRGKIQFQSEGAAIEYRNIKLVRLP